jgi:hypothetical protein
VAGFCTDSIETVFCYHSSIPLFDYYSNAILLHDHEAFFVMGCNVTVN